jgi:hypothetical protein
MAPLKRQWQAMPTNLELACINGTDAISRHWGIVR